MSKKILLIGGMGFIGRKLIQQIAKVDPKVKIICIDNLTTQIHGHLPNIESFPAEVNIEYLRDSAENIDKYLDIIKDIDVVINMASETGTGQSMYEITRYLHSNIVINSKIYELILSKKINIKNYILLSSRAVYGQGKYHCEKHGSVFPDERKISNMNNLIFDLTCPFCNTGLTISKSTEDDELKPVSTYGITKQVQEQILKMVAQNTGLNYAILRLQNVYGAGQSDLNPYTGVINTFSKMILQKQDINLYEDGQMLRNFINVKDVADVIIETINLITEREINSTINVGAEESITLEEMLHVIADVANLKLHFHTSGDYRIGDVRHAIADCNKLQTVLNFKTSVPLINGIEELLSWLAERKSKTVDSSIQLDQINKYYRN